MALALEAQDPEALLQAGVVILALRPWAWVVHPHIIIGVDQGANGTDLIMRTGLGWTNRLQETLTMLKRKRQKVAMMSTLT